MSSTTSNIPTTNKEDIYPPTPPEAGGCSETPPPGCSKTVNNDRSSTEGSPNCAICLGDIENVCSTDSCLHRFCWGCLVEWSKVKATCPLCKSAFKAIIHNIKSDDDYETYNLPPEEPDVQPEMDANGVQFLHQEEHVSFANLLSVFSAMNAIPNASQRVGQRMGGGVLWRRRRGAATSEFRREIYNRNLWVDPESLMDVTGRYRECSPEWFRNNPATTHRLVPFLNRELRVLIEDRDTDPNGVVDLIFEEIKNHEIRSREMYNILRRHLGRHTVHFQRELYYFARSVYDIIGYDRNAVHIERARMAISSSSSSSSDNDVIVVDEIRTANNSNSNSTPMDVDVLRTPLLNLNENTPSTSSAETSNSRLFIPLESENISGDNVEIVRVVKPRHERTPEIIDISTEASGNEDKLICISSDEESPRRVSRSLRRAAAEARRNHRYSFSSSSSASPPPKFKGKGKGKKSKNVDERNDEDESRSPSPLPIKRKKRKSTAEKQIRQDPEAELSDVAVKKKKRKKKKKPASDEEKAHSLFRKVVLEAAKIKLKTGKAPRYSSSSDEDENHYLKIRAKKRKLAKIFSDSSD